MACKSCLPDTMYERVRPQKGIYHFTEGASGELRPGDLKKTEGYDKDCSFLSVEISGDDLYFQAISRTGVTVDSGTIRRPLELDNSRVTSLRR